MAAIKLPAIGDAPVRPRRTRSKPEAQNKTATEAKPRKPKVTKSIQVPDTPADAENAQAVQDLILNDQLERARLARDAAATGWPSPQAPAVQDVGEAAYDEPAVHSKSEPETPTRAPQPAATGETNYIVDDALVNALRAVKSVSIPDFSEYLNELSTMIDLWRNAKSEPAKRRHLLSLLLLLQEKRV